MLSAIGLSAATVANFSPGNNSHPSAEVERAGDRNNTHCGSDYERGPSHHSSSDFRTFAMQVIYMTSTIICTFDKRRECCCFQQSGENNVFLIVFIVFIFFYCSVKRRLNLGSYFA